MKAETYAFCLLGTVTIDGVYDKFSILAYDGCLQSTACYSAVPGIRELHVSWVVVQCHRAVGSYLRLSATDACNANGVG